MRILLTKLQPRLRPRKLHSMIPRHPVAPPTASHSTPAPYVWGAALVSMILFAVDTWWPQLGWIARPLIWLFTAKKPRPPTPTL